MANNTEQARQILIHYNNEVASIMERYVISTPRIRPGNKAVFEAAISHQMDIEQASIASLIESEATRREQSAQDAIVDRIVEMADTKVFGKWTQKDIAGFFENLGKFTREYQSLKQQGDKDDE